MSEILNEFRTPVRILLPKILKSRDDWKAKCQLRRAQNKTLKIKVRDLVASRDSWRQKSEELQAQYDQLQGEYRQLQHRLEAVEVECQEAKKK
jgi:chromosome segregation ATPase